jgi:hypothetical protein
MRKGIRRLGVLALVQGMALAAVWAQANPPHAAYALPAGGRRGTTVEVTVGGQFLGAVDKAFVSGAGLIVKVGAFARPMQGIEAQQLRDKVQELQKKTATPETRREIDDIRLRLLMFAAGRGASPVLAETRALTVTIDAAAETGRHELRLASAQGLSNPIAFYVGRLPEILETEAVERKTGPNGALQGIFQPPTNQEIVLPVVVNGRVKPRLEQPPAAGGQPASYAPGEVDRYRFQARRGQRLVASLAARDITPYLADAVPGWFQAALTLYDAQGLELAYVDDYRFHPDPVLFYEIPADGEYVIEVKDALYRGREDFVYRLSIGELPFITGVFPLGGRGGTAIDFQLTGWNLPAKTVKLDPGDRGLGVRQLSVAAGGLESNSVPIAAGDLPETTERDPQNGAAGVQRISWPVVINGRIDKPGARDVFRFDGRAGDILVAEVTARRLDSPLDSILKLTDVAGKLIASNDDYEDKGAGLETHHADSYIRIALPETGAYDLTLADVQGKSGPEYAYRLRVSAPRPDFELRASPSSVTVPSGMTVVLSVCALRRDGFEGDIRLGLAGGPPGFRLDGGLMPAGLSVVKVTLTASRAQIEAPLDLAIEGRAEIDGREARHLAVPAEDMMQAFAYRQLVPSLEFKVATRRGGAFRAPVEMENPRTVEMRPGEAVRVRFRLLRPARGQMDNFRLELSEPPDGIELAGQSIAGDEATIVLTCDPGKAKPGTRGNLIVNISAERIPAPPAKAAPATKAAPAAKPAAPASPQRIPLGVLPAIPFAIVGK